MNADLLEMFNSTFGGPLARQASTYLGESEDGTRAALRSVGPALLAGLMQRASSPAGVSEVLRSVSGDSVDAGIGNKLAGIFANRGTMGSLLNTGESLSGMLFGPRTGALTHAIADVNGVRPNSAMTLLSLGAPLLLGLLKKLVAGNSLDATGLGSLISRQRASLERSGLDDRITGALGYRNLGELLGTLPGAAATTAPTAALKQKPREKSWMPWAIAAGVALFGVLFLVNRTAEHQGSPGGQVQIAEVPDDTERLRVATADSAKVYFESGDASITAEDRQRIADVAQSARQSERPVAITGYTDQTGDEGQNMELAKDRAMAVRQALVNEGVQEDRIVMDPPRTVTGAGPDDEARRVDIDMR